MFALRWFRESRDVPALARDHGISRATGYRHLGEKTTSVQGEQIDAWCSGKAHEHVLGVLYGAASQLDLPTLADNGYDGAGIGVLTPVKQPANGRVPDVDTRTYNARLRSLRCLGERGFALLTGPLAIVAPHHRQPTQDRTHRQSRTRAHANRPPNRVNTSARPQPAH